MDKFLLADNPMRSGSEQWIIHLLNPKAIIKCIAGHRTQIDGHYKFYQFENPNGVIEEWTLCAYHFFTTDFLTEPEKQVMPLLDRAWRWYRSYREWEDKNIDDDKEANHN